jgi:tetratricopeptide (TPR) repeat protein
LFYKRASELSPKERAPWSNLSAAYFELGDYEQAISACDTALGLLTPTDTDSETAKQKLLTRKARSCFFAGLYTDAGAETDPASAKSVEIETLSKSLQSYYSPAKHVEDHMKARNEIVLNLPRYKPTLYVLLQDRRDTI